MRLLICTQKVDRNDAILGFFHDWIREFAKHCDLVTVICLKQGEYDLPSNVKIFSLGKEKGIRNQELGIRDAFARIKYIIRFYGHIFRERKNYTRVFVHMNSEYVVLGGLFWWIWRKKIALWYVHKGLPWQLRVAEKLVDAIFTASPESCRLKSGKVKVVGHGIDFKKLRVTSDELRVSKTLDTRHSPFVILYVGRISLIKNQLLLLEALDILVNQKGVKDFMVRLVGAPHMGGDGGYLDELKSYVHAKGLESYVDFAGAVANTEIAVEYAAADLAVNLCPTGGMDKAVLEALAAGAPVVVLNKSFSDILGGRDEFILTDAEPRELAEKINVFKNMESGVKEAMLIPVREDIRSNFSLTALIGRLVGAIEVH